ncbi:MAG: LCP family protein [Eggerthellaceae bacterium]
MTEQNVGGVHGRHESAGETRRMGEGAGRSAGGDEGKTVAFGGAHAGLDWEEVRRMNEADKTAVLDYLYDDQPVRERPYEPPRADSSSETVAFSPYRGSHSTASAPDNRDPWGYGGSDGGAIDPGYPDAGKTQVFAPASRNGVQGASGANGYGYDGYSDEPLHSGASYVKAGSNAQVVGYSKKPVRESSASSSRRGRSGGKSGRKGRSGRRTSGDYASFQDPAVFGQGAVSGGKSTRKRRGCLGRLAGSLFRLVLVLAIIAAVPLGFFCVKLDQALAFTDEERNAIESELTPAGFGQPYYTLILGSDSREGTTSDYSERSDVIMLVRVDPLGDQVTLVTVPRDTPYRLSDGSLVKINETYNLEGPAGIIRAVSEVTGVPISHYAEVGFSDLAAIVDSIGGVTVDVDRELSANDALTGEWITVSPGTQTLNGQEALVYARARHEYVYDQDAYRQRNDRNLVTAIAGEIMGGDPLSIPGDIIDVAGYVTTDIRSYNLLGSAIPMFLHPGKTTVYSCSGPIAGDINYESGGLWLCYEDPEGWANLMSVVDAGEDPSSVSYGV